MKQRIFNVVAILLCSLSINATTTTIDGITYKFSIGQPTAEVSSGRNCSGHVVIPSTINYTYYNSSLKKDITETYVVTAIAKSAFSYCDSLISVMLPNTITNIGHDAFRESGLTSIRIPESVDTIYYQMFLDCKYLKDVTIPSNVKSIQRKSFMNCTSLQTITFPDSITTIEHQMFDGCTQLSSVILPQGIDSIAFAAFANCISLEEFILPDSCRVLGSSIFKGCTNLKSIVFPKRLEKAEPLFDINCTSLEYVGLTMTENTPNLHGIFGSRLTKYIKEIELFPGSTCCGTPAEGKNYLPFRGLQALEKVTIPANIAYIPDSCFMNCKKLRETKIGFLEINGNSTANVSRRMKSEGGRHEDITCNTQVGDCAYEGDIELESVSFGPGVTTIGERTFAGCGLTELTLPASITSIGYLAFANNPLTSVDIKCSTQACKDYGGCYAQFENCTNIEKISLLMEKEGPSMYDIFGSNNCYRNIKELIFYEGSTIAAVGSSNGDNSHMPNLTTLKLASTITEIGAYSFNHTTNLKKVTFHSSLTKVGYHAFEGSGLTSITTYAPQPTAETDAFAGRINKTSLKCEKPANETWYQTADIWKDFFTFNNSDNAPTSLSSYEVQINTESHVATVSYPVTYGSAFSELTVTSQESGETSSFEFHFGSAFEIPQRRVYENRISAESADETINGYSFTIQRLTPNTTYDYSILLYDAEENLLEEFVGTFTTQADETTVIDQIGQEAVTNSKKLLRNGQLFILRGDRTYTLTGQPCGDK